MEHIPIDILCDRILPFVNGKDAHALRSSCIKTRMALDGIANMRSKQKEIRESFHTILNPDIWIICKDDIQAHGCCNMNIAINLTIETKDLEIICVPCIEPEARSASDVALLDQERSLETIEMACIVSLSRVPLSTVIQPLVFVHREISSSEAHELHDELHLHLRYLMYHAATERLVASVQDQVNPAVANALNTCLTKLRTDVRLLHDAVCHDIGMAYLRSGIAVTTDELKSQNTVRIVKYVSNKAYSDSAHFLLQQSQMGGLAVVVHIGLFDAKLYVTFSGKVCLANAQGSFAGEKEVTDMPMAMFSQSVKWSYLVAKRHSDQASCREWYHDYQRNKNTQDTDIAERVYSMALTELERIANMFQ